MKKIHYLAVAAVLGLAGAVLTLFILTQHYRASYQQLKMQEQEIIVMAKDYQVMQERILRIEKSAKGENRGVSAMIGELLSSLSISSKLQSVKNIEQKSFLDISRQDAELVVNDLDINEAVNLLYLIEKGSYPVSLRSLEMSRKFESPDIFNLRLVVSYFQKK
ncbi:MAG: hypothetical protein HQL21_08055 [Candidatus Omnitrophica bacterium]|nr:hypothetical protein [Candidatus Omnitrophota bacterium]